MSTKANAYFESDQRDWNEFTLDQKHFKEKSDLTEFTAFRAKHALPIVCDQAIRRDTERRHNVIREDDYRDMTAVDPAGPLNPVYHYAWADIMDFLSRNRMECYDGYLGFNYDESRIDLIRCDEYSNRESMYPALLFTAIAEVHAASGTPQSIHFTWGNIMIRQRGVYYGCRRLVFHVEFLNNTGATSNFYYDMSDDPT